MTNLQKQICPVCGFKNLGRKPYEKMPEISESLYLAHPPYAEHWGLPSYEVCACCGFEFGFDDDTGVEAGANRSFRDYLCQWIADGAPWFDREAKPARWSLLEQLQDSGLPVPQEILERARGLG